MNSSFLPSHAAWCAFACCGALFLNGCSKTAEAPAARQMPKAVVGAAKVIERENRESRRYTGLVVSRSVVNIVPRVSGEVLSVGFRDGEVVKKGQTLYSLDPVQYAAAVKNAEAQVAECKAKLEYAKSNYERILSLFQKNAASKDAMENSRASMGAASASLLSAEAALITANDNLKNTKIVSPQNGMVGVTSFTPGNYITPASGTLVSVIQMQPIRVRFSISTADLLAMFRSMDELLKGSSVQVKLADGSEHSESGSVEFANNEANSKTDAVQVFAAFPNKDFRLIPGSTVTVIITKKAGVKLAAVRPSAIMHDGDGSYVYVVSANGKVEKRYVVCGNSDSDYQLIASGLAPGETVIVKGTNKTRPDAEVEAIFEEK